MAPDCELNHDPILPPAGARGYGCQPAFGAAQMGHRRLGWALVPMGGSQAEGEHRSMRSDPFLDFHQTAERAGYPALLIVSMIALGLVVAPVALLALTGAIWVLVIAVLNIFAALALLAAELGAAFADGDEPPRRTAGQGTTSPRRMA